MKAARNISKILNHIYWKRQIILKHLVHGQLISRADPEIQKMEGAVCRPPCLADQENFRFQVVLKGQNNVRNYKFFTKNFNQYFQIFLIFTYNKTQMMKSCQHFRFYKCCYKEREKTLLKQSTSLCFITGCFIKPFKMIIIFSAIVLFFHKIFVRNFVSSAIFAL